VPGWSLLTNHARVLLAIARDPQIRLREMAEAIGISERRAFGIVTDLAAAGYIVKERDGRRSRYQVQAHLPMREPIAQQRPIGDVLALFLDPARGQQPTPSAQLQTGSAAGQGSS
jgi:DNA-binding IclR family transcriptional regulator